jgi:hypothetical protein
VTSGIWARITGRARVLNTSPMTEGSSGGRPVTVVRYRGSRRWVIADSRITGKDSTEL